MELVTPTRTPLGTGSLVPYPDDDNDRARSGTEKAGHVL